MKYLWRLNHKERRFVLCVWGGHHSGAFSLWSLFAGGLWWGQCIMCGKDTWRNLMRQEIKRKRKRWDHHSPHWVYIHREIRTSHSRSTSGGATISRPPWEPLRHRPLGVGQSHNQGLVKITNNTSSQCGKLTTILKKLKIVLLLAMIIINYIKLY